jgi:regulator of protease activity HflC (stomatin/prohibitin superfamily)
MCHQYLFIFMTDANSERQPHMTQFTPRLFGLFKEIVVQEYEKGLLYKDGKFVSLLESGKYRFRRDEVVSVIRVSRRTLSEVVAGQEMLTSDRIGVRVSLIAQYVVEDPVKAINTTENYTERLYQDLQLALRESISTRDVEKLLDARGELSKEIMDAVTPLVTEYGLSLKRVGIRDVVLPGQVRTIFMQEVEADRKGRAELVKARHEVAAARARANTAKILSENPNIMRLQEIDALLQLANKHGNVIMLPNIADLLMRRDPIVTTPPTIASTSSSGSDE